MSPDVVEPKLTGFVVDELQTLCKATLKGQAIGKVWMMEIPEAPPQIPTMNSEQADGDMSRMLCFFAGQHARDHPMLSESNCGSRRRKKPKLSRHHDASPR